MKFALVNMLAVLSTAAFGSSITNVTYTPGQTYQISGLGDIVDGNQMSGIQITASINGTAGSACTWSGNSCTSDGVTLSFPATTGTDPADGGGTSAFWTITNTNASGQDVTALSISGLPGDIIFDICLNNGSPDASNTPGSYCTTGNAGTGTAGSSFGYTAMGASGGTTSATAAANYSNGLHLGVASPVGDVFGTLTLNFTGTFNGGQTFEFFADTDSITSKSADPSGVPEPGTFALLGSGLLGAGLFSRLRRKSS